MELEQRIGPSMHRSKCQRGPDEKTTQAVAKGSLHPTVTTTFGFFDHLPSTSVVLEARPSFVELSCIHSLQGHFNGILPSVPGVEFVSQNAPTFPRRF